MIETAPEEYWKHLTLDNAQLYCFTLNIGGKIGWRIPTIHEAKELYEFVPSDIGLWTTYDLGKSWGDMSFTIIPVRDIDK